MKDLQVIHGDGYARLDQNDGHGCIAKVRSRPTMTNNVEELGRMARLFAAAPELLEALQRLSDFENVDRQCLCNEPEYDGEECPYCEARAAIAKATGN